jgi:myo-inositol-1(or 4)-monophosphatase
MHPMLNIALRAARDAAAALAQQYDRLDRVKIIKHNPEDSLSSADLDANTTVLHHLQKAHPEHSYQSRVSGTILGKDENTVWLIDPLIANHNFIRGIPNFAVSIACLIGDKLSHAALINPMLNEEFFASRGGGAHLNNRRLRVSTKEELSGSLAILGFPREEKLRTQYSHYHQQLMASGASLRSFGGSAIDIIYAAAGRVDAGWIPNPGKPALAAAALILQEAGGMLSDSHGNPDLFKGDSLVFGNPKCFKHFLKLGKH